MDEEHHQRVQGIAQWVQREDEALLYTPDVAEAQRCTDCDEASTAWMAVDDLLTSALRCCAVWSLLWLGWQVVTVYVWQTIAETLLLFQLVAAGGLVATLVMRSWHRRYGSHDGEDIL